MTMFAHETLRMKLDTGDRIAQVPDPHNLMIVLALGDDLELRRERPPFDHEGVVASCLEGGREVGKDPHPCVANRAYFPVSGFRSTDDLSPKSHSDRLMPQADAQGRDLGGEGVKNLEGDSGAGRLARSGADEDPPGVEAGDLKRCDLVVSKDLDLRSQLLQVLDQVVGKGVVVINHHDHAPTAPSSRSLYALKRPRALFKVSSYSLSGIESATIPAPVWAKSSPPVEKRVRMMMQKSIFPS